MKTLREYITLYENRGKAIGHFNITTIDMLWAVFDAARAVSDEAGEKVPIIIGASEGERDYVGVRQIVEIVHSIQEQFDYPIFINADHTYSVERCKEAIDVGFDMVIIDAAEKPYEENARMTKEVVDYARENGSNAMIEAELGYIGSGSGLKDEMPEGVSEATMTNPDEAKRFVEETGVDALAPAVGNVHGMVKSGNPRLDPERVKAVRESAGVPLVLHGGSGSADEDFTAVIAAGISAIHISTELRKAYRENLEKSLSEMDTVTPYKYLPPAKAAVQKVVEGRIRLFYGV